MLRTSHHPSLGAPVRAPSVPEPGSPVSTPPVVDPDPVPLASVTVLRPRGSDRLTDAERAAVDDLFRRAARLADVVAGVLALGLLALLVVLLHHG